MHNYGYWKEQFMSSYSTFGEHMCHRTLDAGTPVHAYDSKPLEAKSSYAPAPYFALAHKN